MLGRRQPPCYWMSRYMERAENMARLLEVGYRISLMPGAVEGHRDEWRSTLQSAACDLTYESQHDDITAKDVIHFLIFDEAIRRASDLHQHRAQQWPRRAYRDYPRRVGEHQHDLERAGASQALQHDGRPAAGVPRNGSSSG